MFAASSARIIRIDATLLRVPAKECFFLSNKWWINVDVYRTRQHIFIPRVYDLLFTTFRWFEFYVAYLLQGGYRSSSRPLLLRRAQGGWKSLVPASVDESPYTLIYVQLICVTRWFTTHENRKSCNKAWIRLSTCPLYFPFTIREKHHVDRKTALERSAIYRKTTLFRFSPMQGKILRIKYRYSQIGKWDKKREREWKHTHTRAKTSIHDTARCIFE